MPIFTSTEIDFYLAFQHDIHLLKSPDHQHLCLFLFHLWLKCQVHVVQQELLTNQDVSIM